MENNEKIILYGTSWCPDTIRAHILFKRNKVEYTNIDIDDNPEAVEIVKKINNGNRSVPTILFPDGSVLVEPSNRDLREKIAELSTD